MSKIKNYIIVWQTAVIIVLLAVSTFAVRERIVIVDRIVAPKEAVKVETWQNSTVELKTRAFFRYTKTAYASNYVGNTSFTTDVYLVGASLVACTSKDQTFELCVRSGPPTAEVTFIETPNESGTGMFNFETKVYFWMRVDTPRGVLVHNNFLPFGYGILIPKGESVHFSMFAREVGTGGSVTLYYLEL